MKFRLATPEDASALLNIYNQYIDTSITFEYKLPTIEEFQNRIVEYSHMYPYFICENDGKCIGYVYAHRAQERAAYQWNAELSIYLDRNFRKQGLGLILYEMMFEILKLQGVKTLYGLVTTPNPASIKLHEKTGFQLSGIYHNSGYKAGKWCDVLLFEKQINEYEYSPQPIIPFQELDKMKLFEMINKYESMVQA